MNIREKLREQAKKEALDKFSDDDALDIKVFAYHVICSENLELRAQNSGLSSWSADVDVLIEDDEELEGMYARWQIEKEET